MNDSSLETKVATIIGQDSLLRDKCIAQPDAILIPFMQSRSSFYLLVSLSFSGSPQITIEASRLCLNALLLLIRSGIANNLEGIEIVPYVESEGRMIRLFRLSVRKNSFDIAARLREQDLLNDIPGEGITCGWYVQKPSS